MSLFDLFLNKLFPGLLIAVTTAVITVHLSLKRFHSEQWWERKADSYSRIVESLHQIKAWCEDQLEYIEMNQDSSHDKEKELQLKFKKASNEIRRAVDIGSFFISLESERTMMTLWDEMEKAKNEPSFYEYLNSKLKCLNNGLKIIKVQAKKDLSVK
ncbi:MAG: hypothetical protein JRD93_20160 [Deltaproteobacteria bacterium]|nr:hypothetical protein [Deltaproteobacteria bacterium]